MKFSAAAPTQSGSKFWDSLIPCAFSDYYLNTSVFQQDYLLLFSDKHHAVFWDTHLFWTLYSVSERKEVLMIDLVSLNSFLVEEEYLCEL